MYAMRRKRLKIAVLSYGYLVGASQDGVEVINREGIEPGDKIHILLLFLFILPASSC